MNNELNALKKELLDDKYVGIISLGSQNIPMLRDESGSYFLIVPNNMHDMFELMAEAFDLPYGPIDSKFGEATLNHYLDCDQRAIIALGGSQGYIVIHGNLDKDRS